MRLERRVSHLSRYFRKLCRFYNEKNRKCVFFYQGKKGSKFNHFVMKSNFKQILFIQPEVLKRPFFNCSAVSIIRFVCPYVCLYVRRNPLVQGVQLTKMFPLKSCLKEIYLRKKTIFTF